MTGDQDLQESVVESESNPGLTENSGGLRFGLDLGAEPDQDAGDVLVQTFPDEHAAGLKNVGQTGQACDGQRYFVFAARLLLKGFRIPASSPAYVLLLRVRFRFRGRDKLDAGLGRQEVGHHEGNKDVGNEFDPRVGAERRAERGHQLVELNPQLGERDAAVGRLGALPQVVGQRHHHVQDVRNKEEQVGTANLDLEQITFYFFKLIWN